MTHAADAPGTPFKSTLLEELPIGQIGILNGILRRYSRGLLSLYIANLKGRLDS
jgi:hypothetical protein